jgi:hypothetical protein
MNGSGEIRISPSPFGRGMTYLSNQEVLIVANMNAEGVHDFQPRVDARSAATLGNEPTRHGNPEGVAEPAGTPVLNWNSQMGTFRANLFRNPFRVGTCFVLTTQGSALRTRNPGLKLANAFGVSCPSR